MNRHARFRALRDLYMKKHLVWMREGVKSPTCCYALKVSLATRYKDAKFLFNWVYPTIPWDAMGRRYERYPRTSC